MEQGYLIDTNTAIDYLADRLPIDIANLLDDTVKNISVITRMELLSWQNITDEQLPIILNFITDSIVFNLEEQLILATIEIRKKYKLKLPDSIIAATATLNNYILITRNVKDFERISNLKLLNPYQV